MNQGLRLTIVESFLGKNTLSLFCLFAFYSKVVDKPTDGWKEYSNVRSLKRDQSVLW